MSEEVIANITESAPAGIVDNDTPGDSSTEALEQVEQTIETVENTEEPVDTGNNTEFEIDDITFEDEETEQEIGEHQFGSYNLDKYADILPFDDEEVVAELTNYAEILSKQGFTQAQAEWLLEKEINDAQEIEKRTLSDVKETLNKSLTTEEKRNYKPIQRFFQAELENNPNSGLDLKQMMSDPNMVKVANMFYKKQFSGNVSQKTAEKYQVKTTEVQPVDAMRQYREWAENQSEITEESKTTYMKTIMNKASNKDELKELFGLN